jgi:hypothetical protein
MNLQEYWSAYEDIYDLTSKPSAYITHGSNWYIASRRLDGILKEIHNLTPKSIVDIGCGDGVYA